MTNEPASTTAAAPAADPASDVAPTTPTKKPYTLADLKAHVSEASCWVLIHGKVYDVTPFLDEHPGGFDIILSSTGKDASEDFDEIGHSNAAKEQLAQYYLGDFEGGGLGGPARIDKAAGAVKAGLPAGPVSPLVRALQFLLPLLAVLAAVLLPKVLS